MPVFVDFGALNKVTMYDVYKVPVFEEMFYNLYGSKHYSTLDM
jgi:hypothetical protein